MAGRGIHPFHQQWPPAPPPPPPIPGAPAAAALHGSSELRTIFISGLPVDVKERELHNMLRWFPGFEASLVMFKGDQAMGFARFSYAHHALAAMAKLQGMVFDAETKSALHIEMAKRNLFVKGGVGADANAMDQSKRLQTGGDYTHSPYAPPRFHPPPPALSIYMAVLPPNNPYAGYPGALVPMTSASPVPGPTAYAPVQNTNDNPPCDTLFIGNLGETVVEEELWDLFCLQPGFKHMKVLRQDRNTVCFIEFEDVSTASSVHHTLQGAVIPSSGQGGMRIQFSETPFGQMKDLVGGIAGSVNGAPSN